MAVVSRRIYKSACLLLSYISSIDFLPLKVCAGILSNVAIEASKTATKNKISKNLEKASILNNILSPLVIVIVFTLPSMMSIAIIPNVANIVAVANIPGIAGDPVIANLLPPKNQGIFTFVRGILNFELPRLGIMNSATRPITITSSGDIAVQNSVLNASVQFIPISLHSSGVIQIPPFSNTVSNN